MLRVIFVIVLCLWSVHATAWIRGSSPQMFTVTCHGTDDSTAINTAIDQAQTALASGNRAGIYIPTGFCVYKTKHATMTYPVSIFGDGHDLSIIKLDPTLSGDAFSWSDVWGELHNGSAACWVVNPPNLRQCDQGVHIEGLSVQADYTAANQQNAFAFYDRADFVRIEDVYCWWVPGKCLSFGYTLNTTQAFLRESQITQLYAYQCGLVAGDSRNAAGAASVEFTSDGNTDATDEVVIQTLGIFAPHGPGLVIRNDLAAAGARTGQMNIYGLRIEGKQGSPVGYAGDLLQIGDATQTGGNAQINVYGGIFISPYSGYDAIKILANSATAGANTYELNFSGLWIGPGDGGGINIQAGRILRFQIMDMSVSGTALTVGPNTGGIINSPIVIDRNNSAAAFTTSIDVSSAALLFKPSYAAFP